LSTPNHETGGVRIELPELQLPEPGKKRRDLLRANSAENDCFDRIRQQNRPRLNDFRSLRQKFRKSPGIQSLHFGQS
jgi:hypothetical protein